MGTVTKMRRRMCGCGRGHATRRAVMPNGVTAIVCTGCAVAAARLRHPAGSAL